MKVSASGPSSRSAAILAAAWFAAHLPFLAPSLEDIDSINFALGLHDFNPALHQPHPPGYPVYMVLGRLSLLVTGSDALALAIWSAIGGAAAIVGAWRLFAAVERWRSPLDSSVTARIAIAAAALLAVSPLFWVSGLRPMSDTPGLAAVLWAQALAVEGIRDGRRLWIGALLAGIAGGIRIQTLALTLPLLFIGVVAQRAWKPLIALGAGVLAWAVPLVMATGGVAGYRAALASQAGEDFAWVDMLWSNPTPRRLAFSLYETFVLPWGAVPLARVVLAIAAAGFIVALLRTWRALALMLVAFVPYVPYHLLFQETITVRYALPVMPLVAWLAIQGATLARGAMLPAAALLAAAALYVSSTGTWAYAQAAHPAFRALEEAAAREAAAPPGASFTHYSLRRPAQAAGATAIRFVEPRREYEWLGAVDYWRGGGRGEVWFFADPKRTDLELIDPQSRGDVVRYRWAAEQRPELSGTRPLGVDWYRLTPPGWFLDRGWSLTPEAGGLTQARGDGPAHRPIDAWIRRRVEPMHVMIGGRHLGGPGAPDAEFELRIDGALVDRWRLTAAEGNFLRFADLPVGLPGDGEFARLQVVSRAGSGGVAEVAVRQFNVQPASQVISAFGPGWHEDEYEPATGRRWRWSSERSIVQLKGPPRDIRMTLRGESPLRYMPSAPTVKVVAGGQTAGQFSPAADFEWSVVVPGAAWTASGGEIALETDRVYLPGPAEGTSDARRLGLRLFEIRIDPVQP